MINFISQVQKYISVGVFLKVCYDWLIGDCIQKKEQQISLLMNILPVKTKSTHVWVSSGERTVSPPVGSCVKSVNSVVA